MWVACGKSGEMDRNVPDMQKRGFAAAYDGLRYGEPEWLVFDERFRRVECEEGMSRSPSMSATRTSHREGTRRHT